MPPETRSSSLRKIASTADTSLPRATRPPPAERSPAARQRQVASTQFSTHDAETRGHSDHAECIPRFSIDLSLPPEQRYLEVCAAYGHDMRGLTGLFDEVVGALTAELRGISAATGVAMYLLVAFNVLLDLFMGCSSGGAAVRDDEAPGGGTRMLHFRTLDWGMPPLRRLVVQLDYRLRAHGDVAASSITYAGFVGVLTGVRSGLSLSLNFRGVHDDMDVWAANAKYYWYHLMVLLGVRPSISCILRGLLVRPRYGLGKVSGSTARDGDEARQSDYEQAVSQMTSSGRDSETTLRTSACYLCFCDGNTTTVIQRDRTTGKARCAEDFIVVANADFSGDYSTSNLSTMQDKSGSTAAALAEMLDESAERMESARENWARMMAKKARRRGQDARGVESMNIHDVVEMVQRFPTTNEVTHFACVMDPRKGVVEWCRSWPDPVSERWIRAHS